MRLPQDCYERSEGEDETVTQKPNILLFVTEQHRGDCLRIEDHEVLMTPSRLSYRFLAKCWHVEKGLIKEQIVPASHCHVGHRDLIKSMRDT